MQRPLWDTALSFGFVILGGWILWPPRAVYWQLLADYVGEPITLLVVGILAVGFGFVFVSLTSVSVRPFVGGAVIAYIVGMGAIELVLMPDSPVHLILYAGLLLCFLAGAFLGIYWSD